MKDLTKELMNIHNLELYDYMGYDLTDEMEYHHIQKKSKGGKYTLKNGAVLNCYSHDYLHLIEDKDRYDYNSINKVFAFINKHCQHIEFEEWECIRNILDDFEINYLSAVNKKDEFIIKEEYLVRPTREELKDYSRIRK